jgi:hypothetical protein
MEHELKNQTELFPNPERIDKVSNFTWDDIIYWIRNALYI